MVDIVTTRSRIDWLEHRRRLITATDIATLAGARAESTWQRVIAEKTQPLNRQSTWSTQHSEWGHGREAAIAQRLVSRFPDLTHNLEPSRILIVQNTRHAATPDLIGESRHGEIKTVVANSPWVLKLHSTMDDRAIYTKLPRRYRDQLQWTMYVADTHEHLFAWEVHENFRAKELHHILAHRDEERIAHLLYIANEFDARIGSQWPSNVRHRAPVRKPASGRSECPDCRGTKSASAQRCHPCHNQRKNPGTRMTARPSKSAVASRQRPFSAGKVGLAILTAGISVPFTRGLRKGRTTGLR